MGLKPVKVSQLNSYIKRILQTDPILGNLSVIGEVSNLKFHSSGHVYFSLKDENSRINCFLPENNKNRIDCVLHEGMEATVSGYIYLYERGGSYSLNVKNIEETGQGELAAAFEKLKVKLDKKGYFDIEHKKPLPGFPHKIAIITSETGAAVQDMLKIIKKKNKYVDILIYPVLVQGPYAAVDIASAIDDINENYKDIDMIITGRGGGSMEELWAFNEEVVADSIYRSEIPVISAVGHQTDFTISDFVADFRAETPTAAAEMAVPDTGELRETLAHYREELKRNINLIFEKKKNCLYMFDPESFSREIQSRSVLDQLKLDNNLKDIKDSLNRMTESYKNRLELIKETLEASNPKNILKRGYSVVMDEKGKIIKDMGSLKKDQFIHIEGSKGRAEAYIIKSEKR